MERHAMAKNDNLKMQCRVYFYPMPKRQSEGLICAPLLCPAMAAAQITFRHSWTPENALGNNLWQM